MKTVIFTPALVTGGAETMVTRLAIAMQKIGNPTEVVVLSPPLHTPNEQKLEKAGITLTFISSNRLKKFSRFFHTMKTLSAIKPDVIHGHIAASLYAVPYILFHKCHLVHTVHTKPDVEFSPKALKLFKYLLRRNKLTLVAVSQKNCEIAQQFYEVSSEKIKYVNNPVEIENYYKLPHNNKETVFINVSRQDVNKNQIALIRAMPEVLKLVPQARLILVGDGNQHENLKKEVQALGLENIVSLPGAKENVAEYLAKANIYCASSHREGLPLSMLEAMASKLPVISTNVGGVPDLIQNSGILVEDNNPQQLIKAMVDLATDPEKCALFAENGYRIAQQFDAAKCAEAYLKIYSECARKEPKK